MENIDDYLSNLSIESLMDLSETTSSSTFEENSIVRELISRFKLSQSNFTWGLIVLRDNILIEITKRYIQLNIKPMKNKFDWSDLKYWQGMYFVGDIDPHRDDDGWVFEDEAVRILDEINKKNISNKK